MMNSLFSIFDPSTNLNYQSNWISSIFNLLYLPLPFWFYNSRYTKMMSLIIKMMNKEMEIILKNKFNIINNMFFISLLMIILINNFIGLFPYIFTSSSHLIFSLTFSLPLWITLMTFGWMNNYNFMFSHMIPQGTPYILMPFMVLIETISNIIRPMTLMIRLTANMIAGHLLLTLLSSTCLKINLSISIMIIFIQISLMILEFSVSFIQSYVFTVLMVLYSKETNYE